MGPESEEREKFHPFPSTWLRHWLLGAFIDTPNTSSRALGNLLAAGAILATQLSREPLAGGTFSNCLVPPANFFAPSSVLCVLPAVRRPPWLSDILLVTGSLLDA